MKEQQAGGTRALIQQSVGEAAVVKARKSLWVLPSTELNKEEDIQNWILAVFMEATFCCIFDRLLISHQSAGLAAICYDFLATACATPRECRLSKHSANERHHTPTLPFESV